MFSDANGVAFTAGEVTNTKGTHHRINSPTEVRFTSNRPTLLSSFPLDSLHPIPPPSATHHQMGSGMFTGASRISFAAGSVANNESDYVRNGSATRVEIDSQHEQMGALPRASQLRPPHDDPAGAGNYNHDRREFMNHNQQPHDDTITSGDRNHFRHNVSDSGLIFFAVYGAPHSGNDDSGHVYYRPPRPDAPGNRRGSRRSQDPSTSYSATTSQGGPNMFQDASDVNLVSGQLFLGDVHNHSAPVHPDPQRSTPPPLPANGESLSDIESYCSQLLREKRGFPLYIPHSQNVPPEYQEHGITIGDVGSVTQDGEFDFYFNIFLPADHPINADNTPEDFSPMHPCNSKDIFHGNYGLGHHLSSSTIRKVVLDPPASEFPGGQFAFRCNGPQGAVLALPDGSHVQKLRNVESMRTYAAKHADGWYKYVKGARGRELANGDLYLVTGWEKTRSWGMASYHNVGLNEQFQLLFKRTAVAGATYNPYRWGGIKGQLDPSRNKCHDPPSTNNTGNQTVFVHGWSISLPTGLWGTLFGAVQTSSMVDFHSLLNPPHGPSVTGSQSSVFSWAFNFFAGHGATGGKQRAVEPQDVVLTGLSPLSTVFNPAKLINEYILYKVAPQGTGIVMSHNDDWCSILGDDSDLRPSDFFRRIDDHFTITEKDGATLLVSNMESGQPESSREDPVPALTDLWAPPSPWHKAVHNTGVVPTYSYASDTPPASSLASSSEQHAAQRKRSAKVPGESSRPPSIVPCSFCRGRKIECDRFSSNCVRRSLPCNYDDQDVSDATTIVTTSSTTHISVDGDYLGGVNFNEDVSDAATIITTNTSVDGDYLGGTFDKDVSDAATIVTTSSTTHTSGDGDYPGSIIFNPTLPPADIEFDSSEEGSSEEYDSIEVYSARSGGSIDGAQFETALERQMYPDPPIPAAQPVSVPETDGDWRSLSARAGAARAPSPMQPTLPTFTVPGASGGSASFDGFGFDLDWSAMQAGITGLDMNDVAVQAAAHARASTSSARRPSQLSLMLRRPSTRGSVMYDPDTFNAAVRGWGGEEYERQRKYWTFRRDAADGRGGTAVGAAGGVGKVRAGAVLSPVRSITSGRVGMGSSILSGVGGGGHGHSGSSAHGERPKCAPWRGMALNAEEIWNNSLVGSFKVRRIELRLQKPQQRVTIDPFPGLYTMRLHDGAYTNIHKHSKVMAFSIHRHYKPARAPPHEHHVRGSGSVSVSGRSASASISGRGSVSGTASRGGGGAGASGGGGGVGAGYEERRRPTAVILLAPRHVQEAYTSTNTTKRLRSHGLLDEGRERDQDHRHGGRDRDRDWEMKRDMKISGTIHGTRSMGKEKDIYRLLGLDDDEDSDAEQPAASSRTTHNEAFSSMDASSIDQMVLAQDARYGEPNSVLSRILRRAPIHPVVHAAPPQVYIPPWVTLQSRVKQEERRRRQLSNSFEDVGLLPPKKSTDKMRAKKAPVGVDIFAQVPSDALFMLLPLWPGPTDPVSERNATRAPHEIPTEQRQYLLVSYKPTDERALPGESGKASKRDEERANNHSSSADDAGAGPGCDTLLHISARLVSHADLQGSGLRVPDEGLAVLGPWHEAWLSMPQIATRDHGLLVIGTCASREAGVEFDPEGLVKMGLCIPVPPDIAADDGLQEEPVAELTPIGKAVLEMVWIGCVAVTSFGPAGSS
ncbi:hypothetical protein DFH06DRAFT_1484945 [Mycena polygramma]|nr:hypothetical protein DFH06DRAFT_1484945 [Mycena polygramma]